VTLEQPISLNCGRQKRGRFGGVLPAPGLACGWFPIWRGVASKSQPGFLRGIGWHHTQFDSEEFIRGNSLDRGHFKLGAGAQGIDGKAQISHRFAASRTYISRYRYATDWVWCCGCVVVEGRPLALQLLVLRYSPIYLPHFVSWLELLHGLFALTFTSP
jgi:hypothetical protein